MTEHRDARQFRGPIVHTRGWPEILGFYQDLTTGGWAGQPMVRLVEALIHSEVSQHLYGAPATQTLFLSDEPDFHLGDNTLHIRYDPTTRTFDFLHQNFSGGSDRRSANEAEVLETLSLFVEYKFGLPAVFQATD